MKNKLISFEGIDGAGKSLQIKLLTNYLESRAEKFLIVREPGSTAIGEKIRDILVDKKNNAMSDMTEALLFMSARAQLVAEKIIPALKNNYTVICDRFIDSSVVYQGIGRGLGKNFVQHLNEIATGNLEPDITFFLDVPAQNVLQRKIATSNADRFEAESLRFHEKIYAAYKGLALENKNRIVSIDATQSPEKIHAEIISLLFH